MPRFYSELQHASLENLASDPTAGVAGRIIRNTTDGRVKVDNSSTYRAILINDDKCVIGNNGTANNNIRLHRGASGVLQFVQGGDATAEGSLSTALNQISFRAENYTDSGKPSAGNAGRILWITDLQSALIDNGTSYQTLGGGGGGGSLNWIEAAEAPLPDIENNFQVYKYQNAITQQLYCSVRVPNSYLAGRQVNLRFQFYSPDTSNTVLFRTQATLIKNLDEAVTATTNQRTSTNSAITLATTANRLNGVVCDLTSSTGTINSVAIAAGDLIQVRLYRDTDTATSDARFLPFTSEVTFA